MAELVETRWCRYGKDRVYVKSAEGLDVGHVDLITGHVETRIAGYDAAMAECARRWMTASRQRVPLEDDMSVMGVPSSHAASREAARPGKDYAHNVAGAAARAKRDEVNAQSPKLNLFARLLGVKTPERAWRVGAQGEEKVAAELAKLPADWRVLHAVEVGAHGSDIDHVVIGPAGVFTLNTKRHPGGNAWVGARVVMVNGQRTPYLRNSEHEARRAARRLTKACGFDVPVRSAIVFVDLDRFTVKQMPADVHVTTRRRLIRWLRDLPATMPDSSVQLVYDRARNSSTWI